METSDEYDRLVRFLEQASTTSGIHLALVRYEHGEVARSTRTAVIAAVRSSGGEVAEVDFSDADDDVDLGARLQFANARAPIVFATGLERLLLDFGIQPRATNAIAKFNFDRDLLPERMHGVLVLWLSYRAARAFATFARDTFDVISTSFDFPEVLGGQSEIGSEFVTMDNLPEWATLAPLARVPELEERARLLESLHADAPSDSPAAADLATSLGKIASALGHMNDALSWFEAAASSHERGGDIGRAASVRRWRAGILTRLRQFEEAEREIIRAKQLAKCSLDPEVEFEIELGEAELEHFRGSPARAREILESILSKTSKDLLRAAARSHLAGIQLLAGEVDSALDAYDDLMKLYGALGKPWDRARAANARAAVFAAKHQYDEALQILRGDVLPAFQKLGDLAQAARTVSSIAAILANKGEFEQAVRLLEEQVIPVFMQLNDASEQAHARDFLAALRAELDPSKDPSKDPEKASTR